MGNFMCFYKNTVTVLRDISFCFVYIVMVFKVYCQNIFSSKNTRLQRKRLFSDKTKIPLFIIIMTIILNGSVQCTSLCVYVRHYWILVLSLFTVFAKIDFRL